MENSKPISIEQLVELYQVERSFFTDLGEFGLIRIIHVENTPCIDEECLPDLERIIRLRYELDINMAGIDAIWHLLRKVEELQHEINRLRNITERTFR